MKEQKKEFKTNGGITLIALVITIIVLLILAGVSISMLTGDSSLLNQAANAKETTGVAQIEENINLAVIGALGTSKGSTITKSNLVSELNSYFGEDGYTISDESSGWTVTVDGNEYSISEYGDVTEKGVTWTYTKDSEGKKITGVTNGEITLEIGDYINYDAKDTEDGEEVTATSYAGSPIDTDYYTATDKTLSEGNGYAETTFSSSTDTGGWRVLGIDEDTGELLIISANVIQSRDDTDLGFRGIAGYTYGESELNRVCSVFGYGTGATGARSVNVNDINKITGYNPNYVGTYDSDQTLTGNPYGSTYIYEYGNKLTYSWYTTKNYISYSGSNEETGTGSTIYYATYGFNWYDEENKVWKNSTQPSGLTAETITTLTSSYYYYYPCSLTTTSGTTSTVGLTYQSDAYNTLFCNTSKTNVSYWLASSYVTTNSYGAYFGLRIVSSSGAVDSFYNMYFSYGYVGSWNLGVRPVVSLESGIQLSYNSTDGSYDIVE